MGPGRRRDSARRPHAVRRSPATRRTTRTSRPRPWSRRCASQPTTAYSGTVEIEGRLGLPIADHFSDLADLFGGETRLRVWWRSGRRLAGRPASRHRRGRPLPPRSHHTEWNYERDEARSSGDPEIRLPRDSDLLPPEIARRALDGAAGRRRHQPARPAGRRASTRPGSGVQIADARSSLDHVDLWVDPATGVTLSAEVYGDSAQPAVSSTFTTYSGDSAGPRRSRSSGRRPVCTASPSNAIDIADAADQYAPVTHAGLRRRARTVRRGRRPRSTAAG